MKVSWERHFYSPGPLGCFSTRIYAPPGEPDYPYHDQIVRVPRCGRICLGRRKINLSSVFADQTVGTREVDDQIWLVSFLEYDLGHFDKERDRVAFGKCDGTARTWQEWWSQNYLLQQIRQWRDLVVNDLCER